jgi:hypothetical protein
MPRHTDAALSGTRFAEFSVDGTVDPEDLARIAKIVKLALGGRQDTADLVVTLRAREGPGVSWRVAAYNSATGESIGARTTDAIEVALQAAGIRPSGA